MYHSNILYLINSYVDKHIVKHRLESSLCKRNSLPKRKFAEMYTPSDHPRSGLEKCVIASVSQQWMLCSEWVPSE